MIENLIFRLFSITFINQDTLWWQDTSYMGRIFQAIQETEFRDKFSQFGIDGGKRFKKFNSFAQLVKESTSWQEKPYLLKGEQNDISFSLGITIRKNAANLFLKTEGNLSTQQAAHYINEKITFGSKIHLFLKDSALLGSDFHITQLSANYPRPKPPRKHPRWPIGSLVDFMSKSYFLQKVDDGKNLYEKLRLEPLPPGVICKEQEDLLVFVWANYNDDDEQIATGRLRQETYLSQWLEWPIAAGYNKWGDKQEMIWGQKPHPPLTFYDEVTNEGYKAVVENPDGSLDEALFTEIASWLSEKFLPDKTTLSRLHLIVPNRKTALAIRQRADQIGISKVLYTADDKMLWNPWPPGQWLEQSSQE